jgi:hypothetical protein
MAPRPCLMHNSCNCLALSSKSGSAAQHLTSGARSKNLVSIGPDNPDAG